MRKTLKILSMTIVYAFVLSGCTMLPASQETGIGPEEYAEVRNTEKTKKENESLAEERDNLKSQLEKMEKDYLEVAKNNETMTSKLEEAEMKLNILESDGIPRFNSEKNDKNSIVAYLNNNKNILEKSLRGIEMVDSPDESSVLFYTTGYGDNFNQLFVWSAGESEPVLIDGAAFEKAGSLNWINNKYMLIDTGNDGGYKILDKDSKNIIGTFYSKQDVYLIPETATFILQKPDTGVFVLYDFISLKEQEIDLDYKNKYTSFETDEENNKIIFTGIYTDEYDTSYSVEAVMNIEKMKEKYNVVTLEKAIEMKENNGSNSTEGVA
ncbi:MAG TPA: hypothetical protein DCM73_05500 [Clostridiales bacterium]|nr:hypothetical protein [Clostridiales bacterium]